MAYGSFVLMRDLNFVVRRGDIFIIMGGSGCGKSTLLRHLIGLKEPATGEIIYGDINFTRAEPEQRERLLRRFGILYQSGALWSSMTLAENIGLPLGEFTDLTPAQIREIAALKLALVGLKGFEDFYPNQLRKLNPILRGWGNYYRFCTGASQIFASLDYYVGDRIWRWLMKKHKGLKRKRTTLRRQPSGKRPTRKLWRAGPTEQFLFASLRVERFRRGWMKTPAFAMVPGEPDA